MIDLDLVQKIFESRNQSAIRNSGCYPSHVVIHPRALREWLRSVDRVKFYEIVGTGGVYKFMGMVIIESESIPENEPITLTQYFK